jgi:NhaP-type Na+/H+ or K+/H+ antiporter
MSLFGGILAYFAIGVVGVSLVVHLKSFINRRHVDPVEFALYVALWLPCAVFFALVGIYKLTGFFLKKIQGMYHWETFDKVKTPKLSSSTELYMDLAKQAEKVAEKK